MKRLFVLRHAQTFPSQGGSDLERKLTPRGMEDALNLGQAMREKNYVPDFVWCSPATRTRQTLDQVMATLGKLQVEYQKIIYEGGYEDLLELAQATEDRFSSVLIVGHNPSIHQFAASFAREDNAGLMSRIESGYAPGTLSVLDAPQGNWVDIKMGAGALVDLIEAHSS